MLCTPRPKNASQSGLLRNRQQLLDYEKNLCPLRQYGPPPPIHSLFVRVLTCPSLGPITMTLPLRDIEAPRGGEEDEPQ